MPDGALIVLPISAFGTCPRPIVEKAYGYRKACRGNLRKSLGQGHGKADLLSNLEKEALFGVWSTWESNNTYILGGEWPHWR